MIRGSVKILHADHSVIIASNHRKGNVMAKKKETTSNDLIGKTTDELTAKVAELKKELFNLRFQKASGELANTSRLREAKREIARVLTHLRQQKKAA
jgi:large subunit ribosomal protein L29